MITWFDRLRAKGQGRMIPESFTAPGGENVFVLGADGALEEAVLQGGDAGTGIPGDYSEVKQIVDLSDWDLVAATFDSAGTLMSQAQPASSLGDVPAGMDALWWFNYNVGIPTVKNLVSGGFDLLDAGDIEVGSETYSPVPTRCRVIPVGSTTAQLAGVNTPQFLTPSPLNTYTLQFWLNFDSVSHVTSWGVSPQIFSCVDGTPNGIEFALTGAAGPGAHSWYFDITHHFGGSSGTSFPGLIFDTPNLGWKLVTVTWNLAAAAAFRHNLYIDDNPVPYPTFVAIGNSPVAPAAGTAITIADPDLWGAVDEMRMLDGEMSPAEIAASFASSTTLPTPIDYQWLMQIIVNEEVYAERIVQPTERRRWTDFQVPVRHLSGPCEVGFKLQLQEV